MKTNFTLVFFFFTAGIAYCQVRSLELLIFTV